ncbi:hypothetical protein ACFXAF_27460 [Kitasatospora sp. NPDC059463]|uniref:hypothetical protein n=1 Tax=unclassified Kitasatospora TaxID=2633591 RepID=UPI003685CF7E
MGHANGADGGGSWPAGAVFSRREIVRLRNPAEPSGDGLFLGDELVGSAGVVVEAVSEGGDISYGVYLVQDGSLWSLPGEFLESAGELSPLDPLAAVNGFLGCSAEILDDMPDVPMSCGDVVEVVGVGMERDGSASTYAVHVPPDGEIVVVAAAEIRFL